MDNAMLTCIKIHVRMKSGQLTLIVPTYTDLVLEIMIQPYLYPDLSLKRPEWLAYLGQLYLLILT